MWLPSPEELSRFDTGWCISSALQAEIVSILGQLRPKSILELGSGLSTLIFRKYANDVGAEIVSLEQNETGLPGGFYPKNSAPLKPFDLILHDGPRGTARRVSRDAWGFLKPRIGRVVIIDDTNRPAISEFANSIISGFAYRSKCVQDHLHPPRESLILERC